VGSRGCINPCQANPKDVQCGIESICHESVWRCQSLAVFAIIDDLLQAHPRLG
jgi:hypothetical protein